MKKNKVAIFKIILTIIVIVILIGITVHLFPVIRILSTIDGQIEFKQKIEDSGVIGLLLLFGLEVAQIFLFIVPGEPIEILAGMCYGAVWGTIFIMLSAGITTSIILLMVKKWKKSFVVNFCDEKKVNKIVNSKLFQNPQKIEMIMIILFLIPGTPKDLLVYVAGLLPINPIKFILISTIARFPSVISSTLVGANITQGNWKFGIILYLTIILVAVGIIFVWNKFDKDKTTYRILETLK